MEYELRLIGCAMLARFYGQPLSLFWSAPLSGLDVDILIRWREVVMAATEGK